LVSRFDADRSASSQDFPVVISTLNEGVSNQAKRNLGRQVFALDPLADAPHYGRHRPRDLEGRVIEHRADRPVILLYRTLELAQRRSGHVIMLVVGFFAALMPVMHMRGAHYGDIAKSAGGFFFVWTLWALGGLGGLTLVLSARGLWSLRRRSSEIVHPPLGNPRFS
jgi:hypothetical protein